MIRSTPWFLLVVCLAGIALARESRRAGPMAGADRAFFDWLIANARLPPATSAGIHSSVTLVQIDDSVADTPGRLPLTPLEYASFLQVVAKFEPAVVAIEPVLNWAQPPPAGTEEILANQAIALPKLLLGVELGSNPQHSHAASSLPALGTVTGGASAVPSFPEIVAAPTEHLQELAAAAGATNLPGISDAPVRDLPLLFRSRDRVLPSFALQTLMLWLQLAPSEISVQLGGRLRLGEVLQIPINRQGRALLDARLYRNFTRLNLDDLSLLAANQAPPEIKSAAAGMRGGIVILGRTDQKARTLQMVGGQLVSPAEIFAWSAVSLARVPSVRRAGNIWDAAVVVLWMFLGWRLMTWKRSSALTAVLVIDVAYGLVALSFFEMQRRWLPGTLPVCLSFVVAALCWVMAPKIAAAAPPPAASDGQI